MIAIITIDPPGKYADGMGPGGKGEQPGSLLGTLGLILILIFVGLSVFPALFLRHSPRRQNQLLICQSNMKNIATALEMYSTDNKGNYPPYMESITPNYLKIIPTCPSARNSLAYTGSYHASVSPDAYSFCCAGSNHTSSSIPANYPLYDSQKGLIVKP